MFSIRIAAGLAALAVACLARPLAAQPAAGADPTPGYAVRQLPSGPAIGGGAPGGNGLGNGNGNGGRSVGNSVGRINGRAGAGAAGGMRQRFQQANITHDGKLTMDQARSARMPFVARHFNDIDTDHKGYITMDDVRSYRQRLQAQRQGGQAGSPQVPPAQPGPPGPYRRAPGATQDAGPDQDPDAQ